MKSLDLLQSLLDSAVMPPLARPWNDKHDLEKHLKRLNSYLKKGAASYVPRDLLEEAIRNFWTTKRIDSFGQARFLSFGITFPVGPQRLRVIEDKERFFALLKCVDAYLSVTKQFRRCYQGLLSGYFIYDPREDHTPATGRDNWRVLRQYLSDRSNFIVEGGPNPKWVDTLEQHLTIFDENPCSRYGPTLLEGDDSEVNELKESLNIPEASWFISELILAQIEAAARKPDFEFRALIPRSLVLLRNHPLVRDRGLAIMLDRFASITPHPLELSLRDAAVGCWGNPWLKSNSMRWGHVTPEARAMVTEWLKLEFIEAFFTLLAEEQTGDSRRLAFWRRYVDVIEDIHFALGAEARNSKAPDFVTLRKKMLGLVVHLEGASTNNAFLMRIGKLLIVEFSGYNNACYGYDVTKPLPFHFDRPVVLPVDSWNSLKQSSRVLRLSHQDEVHGYVKWEHRFEAFLADNFDVRPKNNLINTVVIPHQSAYQYSSRPTTSQQTPSSSFHEQALPASSIYQSAHSELSGSRLEIQALQFSRRALDLLVNKHGLIVKDLTAMNGLLWIVTDDSNLEVNKVLCKWGFIYKNASKGWWRES